MWCAAGSRCAPRGAGRQWPHRIPRSRCASAQLPSAAGLRLSSPAQGGIPMKMPILALALSMASMPALAATFVYVSNAEDGDIGMYTLQADGSLQPGLKIAAAKV